MKVGVGFPQTEIGTDPSVIRDYAQAAETLGYHHILTSEHVLGADVTDRPDWESGIYTVDAAFHEPLVLFGYLAGVTTTIEFVTGVLVLPQRQTVLVAKQAAEVDILTGGRLCLGIGVGYNEVEYRSIGADFKDRGRRIEEQIHVLRLLWTQRAVRFDGDWHRIEDAGINPLPVQRPIPLVMGGNSERALTRAARIADGWFPSFFRPEDREAFPDRVEWLREAVRVAGRDPSQFEIRAQMRTSGKSPGEWRREAEAIRDSGVDYLTVNTMRNGHSAGEHIAAIQRVMEVLRDVQ